MGGGFLWLKIYIYSHIPFMDAVFMGRSRNNDENPLTHFIPPGLFLYPLKKSEAGGISGGIERNQWNEMR